MTLESDNPALQFVRSRLSPMGSAVTDKLIFGESYIGQPLDNPVDISMWLGSKFLPFSVNSALMSGATTGNWGNVPAEFTAQVFGLRAAEQTRAERLDRLAIEQYKRPYTELNAFEQADIMNEPEIQNLPLPRGESGDRMRRQKQINDAANEQVEGMVSAMRDGVITKSQFRTFYNGVMADKGSKLSQLDIEVPTMRDKEAQGRYQQQFSTLPFDQQELMEKLNNWTPMAERDRVAAKYYSVMEEKDPITGGANYEGAEEYLASQPQEVQNYILQKQVANKRIPEVAQLIQDRQALRPYWAIRDRVYRQFGIKARWDSMTPAEQEKFKKNPLYQLVEKQMAQQKEMYRMSHPKIDKLLVDWYNRVPIMQQKV
jgi:hypothetical protein